MKLRVFLILLALLAWAAPVAAQEPVVGEIRLWAGTAATIPDGWEISDGTELSQTTYSGLYAVVGCTYGCNGSDFAVPNLSGRVPVGYSTTGADSEFDTLGETGGEKTHTLTTAEMPSHNHQLGYASSRFASGSNLDVGHSLTGWHASVTNNQGGGQPHNNLQPYIVLNYIIYTGVLSATPTPTPTATPTGSVTPTATTTSTLYLPYIITTTLNSGTVLSVPEQVSFGQIITSGIVLSLLAVVALDFIFRVVYRR